MKKLITTLLIASTLPLAAFAGYGDGNESSGKDKSYDKKAMKADIVDTAAAAGDFNTLVAALKAADLVETLKGEGPFTVFAPTDEAFEALPEGTVENLLRPENKEMLTAVLTYHVVPSKVKSKDVKPMEAPTVNGQTATIEVKDGKVTIEGANVIKTDIYATNGVIHVIDKVILPE